jgi:tetratricopeptide (TPR) repeat protein
MESAIHAYRQAIAANGSLPEAKFNLGALLINEGGRLARQNQLQNARNCFQEAVSLYEDVLKSKQAIPSAQENLTITRNNLARVNVYLGYLLL